MKKIIKVFLPMFIIFLLVGCNDKQSTVDTGKVSTFAGSSDLSYEDFKSAFFTFKKNFNPTKFSNISSELYTSVTTSFPENNIDTREIDTINNNILFPTRYEIFYRSNDTNLLVKLNFIYFPQSKKKQFIAINSISSINNSNIKEKFHTISRPLIDEYLISLNGYLVLINFIDTNVNNINMDNSNSNSEKYNHEFILSTLSFYEQFEKTLISINGDENDSCEKP